MSNKKKKTPNNSIVDNPATIENQKVENQETKKNKISSAKNQKNKFNSYINKNTNFINNYMLYSSIVIFVLMFFTSLFINAKVGYYLNGEHFNNYNNLLTPGIVFGVISLILYLPIVLFNVSEFINLYVYNKKISLFNYSLFIYLFINHLTFLILIFVFSFVNYKLFYIFEIMYIFVLLIFVYKKIDNTYSIDFDFIKKINSKTIQC